MGKDVKVKKEQEASPQAAAPWHPLTGLRDQIDRLFEDFDWSRPRFGKSLIDFEPFTGTESRIGIKLPAVDLIEDDGHYVMTAEMPGITEKDIEVALSEGVLTVKGEKKHEREEKKDDYRMSERQYGSFQRSFRLPADVDADKITATCKDGVLTVTIPRKPEAKPKVTKIKVASGS
ncbi:MAG: Hsp20/alpha crystallin family protein [Alphaproteobacteria bacterium]